MVRSPSCAKVGLNRGAWCASEDQILINYVNTHGEGRWKGLPQRAGLNRCGKSCRLRWLKYLRPDIKRGNISLEEEELIFRLHSLLGNRWSLIAGRLPGRTDNEIKNYWNSNLSKKLKSRATIKSGKQLNNWKETNPVGSSLAEVPQAIRPKAVRCTRVFVPPEEGNQIAKNYLVSNWNGEGPSQLEGSSNSLMDLDMDMDMDMGDSFVANLLNSDFYQVYVDDETRSENHNIAGRDDGLMINNTSSSSDCPLSAHGDSTNATMLQDWTGSDLPLEPNFTLELKMLANFLYSEDDRME